MRIHSLVAVILGVILLTFGGFVTSFRVGMADPVWPTEPWFLFSNTKWDFGFVIEHTHRLVGWVVGLTVSLLAICIWWTEPNKLLKWIGFAAIIGLLAGYGEFHRGMGHAWNELKTMAATELGLDAKAPNFESTLSDSRLVEKVKSWPTLIGIVTLILAVTVVACGVLAGISGDSNGWLRCMALMSLVAIMVQGLLGGFRVFFNALAGANLAAIHGAFGQITFCLLIAVWVLTEPRRPQDTLPERERETFISLAGLLALLLALQLLFAVMLRHGGSGLSQRLHIIMAFAVTAAVIWLLAWVRVREAPRLLFSNATHHLAGMLALQLVLGVESYIGKFAATGAQAQVLPVARQVMKKDAITRTAHQLVGCGMLASAVALMIRAGRRPIMLSYQQVLQEKEVPPVAVMALNLPHEEATTAKAPDVASMALEPPDEGILR